MAVTSIWPIKGRVDKVINYARNPEKTHDKEKLFALGHIYAYRFAVAFSERDAVF